VKILYFSDNYASFVMGIKRSMFEELLRRKIDAIFINKSEIGNVLRLIDTHSPDQIWLAHSGLVLPQTIKKNIKVVVVGFGFSDPNYFTEDRLLSYDVYITNNLEIWRKYKTKLPTLYNPTSCNPSFHKSMDVSKIYDVSIIGTGTHPYFSDKKLRSKTVNMLRKDGFRIHVFGEGWDKHPDTFPYISDGKKFIEIINKTRIGIDIQEERSSLAHRMLEYGACGVPMITKQRLEVSQLFEVGKEILTYKDYTSLTKTLSHCLQNEKLLRKVGNAVKHKCISEHSISHRVDNILKFLSENC